MTARFRIYKTSTTKYQIFYAFKCAFLPRSKVKFTMSFNTVCSQPSLGGTYAGIEPMGLLWSVAPSRQDRHRYLRLQKKDPTKPLSYTIRVSEGDHRVEGKVLDSMKVQRHYLAPYVETIPVQSGLLKAMLFLPKMCKIYII